jgi:hypothetical protein
VLEDPTDGYEARLLDQVGAIGTAHPSGPDPVWNEIDADLCH